HRHSAEHSSESVESDAVVLQRAETELLAARGRLDGDVQVAVRPVAESAGRRRAALRSERGPELGDQLLPLAIRGRARKVDDARYSDGKAERSPHGRLSAARVERSRGFRDTRRLDASFLTDALELIEGEAALLGGQRAIADGAGVGTRRETENLAHLVLLVAPFGHGIDCTPDGSCALPLQQEFDPSSKTENLQRRGGAHPWRRNAATERGRGSLVVRSQSCQPDSIDTALSP